jgi:hypothetical protein
MKGLLVVSLPVGPVTDGAGDSAARNALPSVQFQAA